MRAKYIIAAAAFLLIVVLYFGWVSYWSPEAQANRELGQKIDRVNQAMTDFETAMRNDTYGGKTPEETLQMFIDALKKGDMELASKYFMLDTNTQSPNYLTRKKFEGNLQQREIAGEIGKIVEVISKARPYLKDRLYESDYKFTTISSEGKLESYIDLELNKYSGVWKIESL